MPVAWFIHIRKDSYIVILCGFGTILGKENEILCSDNTFNSFISKITMPWGFDKNGNNYCIEIITIPNI